MENVSHTHICLSLMLCKNDLDSLAVPLDVIFYTSDWHNYMLFMNLLVHRRSRIVRIKYSVCSAGNYLV